MSRDLGPRQRETLRILQVKGRVTVAELSDALGLTDRRTRTVIDSLGRRVAVTREQIGTQATGRPVNGNVVWHPAALFERDADRWSADQQARAIARGEQAVRESRSSCPCCGQAVPTGARRRLSRSVR